MLRQDLKMIRDQGVLAALVVAIVTGLMIFAQLASHFGWMKFTLFQSLLPGGLLAFFAFAYVHMWRGKACSAAEYRDQYLNALNWQGNATKQADELRERIRALSHAKARAESDAGGYFCQLIAHTQMAREDKPRITFYADANPAKDFKFGPFIVYVDVADDGAEPWYVPMTVGRENIKHFNQSLVMLRVDAGDFERINRIAKVEGRDELLHDYLNFFYEGNLIWDRVIGDKLRPAYVNQGYDHGAQAYAIE